MRCFNSSLLSSAAFFELTKPRTTVRSSGHLAQRFEAAGALVVVLEQEALEARIAKDLGDRAVVSRGVELALIVSAAEMQSKDNSGMVADHRIVHLDREIEQAVGIIAALPVPLPQLRIKQRGVLRRIDLNVRAAQANQLLHFSAQDVDQIGKVASICRIGAGGFLAVVVSRRLLCADQGGLGRMIGARPHVGEFLGAHRTLAPQLGNDYRPGQNQFLSLFITERNGPAAELVEAFDGVNQVTEKA